MPKIEIRNLGLTDYLPTWELQKQLFHLRVTDKISDTLLLNEHQHVYTFGKNSDENHLLAESEELRAKNVKVVHIDRGGDVTYHGPGQLVGYPIINLEHYYPDVHRYLRDLEEVIIRTLADYDVIGCRDEAFTGVWVGGSKIAAIGVKVSRWVTMHGFAFNVNTDLSYFEKIIPCGIFHKGVTSLENVLGKRIPMEEITQKISYHFGEVFGAEMIERSSNDIAHIANHIIEKEEHLQEEVHQ